MHPITLSLQPQALVLTIDGQQHLLPIGLATLVQAFGQRMPHALALENAIALVEDAIMPITHLLPAQAQLYSADPWVQQIVAHASGNPQAQQASREAVETLFSALARQAESPGYRDPQLPQSPEAAAALLVLRECLHHWSLQAIALHPGSCAQPMDFAA